MNVGELFVRMALDPKQYEKDLGRMEGVTRQKAMTLGSIFEGAFSFALGMGLVQGFRSLGDAITDFVNTAARTEVLDIAMRSVAKSSGYVIAGVNAQKKAVMDLGIAEQEATQILTRFMQAQLDTADASKLARVAQDAAVIAGTNSSAAALQMTDAIAKLRPELLEQFGMTKNLTIIYKDYATEIGKTVTRLTEAEKQQAMLNYLLGEGEKIAGTYEASMGAVGKQIGSLPRYWDTLKNAIAKPLALPVISVIVDGMTNSLKNAISWAEANTSTLQRWGQTAVNVAQAAGQGFRFITRTVAENWQTIKITGAALFTYAAGAKVAAGAAALFALTSQILNGTLTTKTGLLYSVSVAAITFQVQMVGAAIASNILSKALLTAKAALYALHAALGPIGWALIALSVLVAGGMSLWNKYNQTLQKTPKISADIAAATGGATKSFKDQADAMKEAGKAANKNLQAFDQVHQLQDEDMGGAGMDALDPGLELIPELNFEEMLAGFEVPTATLSGFWDFIKQGASDAWKGVKIAWAKDWEIIKEFVATAWNGVTESWNTFIGWAAGLWEGVKIAWGTFAAWVVSWAGPLWDGIKGLWSAFATWAAGLWEGVKIAWGTFAAWVVQAWNAMGIWLSETWNWIIGVAHTAWGWIMIHIISPIQEAWNWLVKAWGIIVGFLENTWGSILRTAKEIWDDIKTAVRKPINSVIEWADTTWSKFVTTLENTWGSILRTAKEIWDDIKTAVRTRAETLVIDARRELESLWTYIRGIPTSAAVWGANIISGLWNGISGWANQLNTNVRGFIERNLVSPIKSFLRISSPSGLMMDFGQSVADGLAKGMGDRATTVEAASGNIGKSIINPLNALLPGMANTGKGMIEQLISGIGAMSGNLQGKVADITRSLQITIPQPQVSAAQAVAAGIKVTVPAAGLSSSAASVMAMPAFAQMSKAGQESLLRSMGVPGLAKGGIVTRPMLAMIGEAGPEAVVPLGRSGVTDDMATSIAEAVYGAIRDAFRSVQAEQSASGQREVVLNIDGQRIARAIIPPLVREGQRAGSNFTVVRSEA